MTKRFKTLLIEDDKSFGISLQKALEKTGTEVQLCHTPESAQTLCTHGDFDLIIADCMLPRMNGVDLVEQLKRASSIEPKVILITGVFKDKGFLSEATRKTQAEKIFSKPFDLNEFCEFVGSLKEEHKEDSNAPLYSPLLPIYCTGEPGAQLNGFLDRLDHLEGLHLPFLISTLMATKTTGSLYVTLPSKVKGRIGFEGGHITQVQLDQSKTLIGHLLMDLGFLEPEDLKEALENQKDLRIGEKLIDQMSISPHAINLALAEQKALRLSQMVTPGELELKFEFQPIESNEEPPITEKRIRQLFQEIGESKYDHAVLEEFLAPSLHFKVKVQTSTFQSFAQSTLFQCLSPLTPGEALVHLFCRDILPLPPENNEENSYKAIREKYEFLRMALKKKNHFEVLGLSIKSLNRDIERAYSNIKKSMNHNHELLERADALDCYNEILHRVELAYKILSNDLTRSEYKQFLDAEAAHRLMNKSGDLQEAIYLLESGDYARAFQKFRALDEEKLNFQELKSYLIVSRSKANRSIVLESELNSVYPEHRQNAAYMLAKAFFYKGAQNYEMAIQYFKRALIYEPKSKFAMRELESSKRRLAKKKSKAGILGGVVDSLFSGSSKKKVS